MRHYSFKKYGHTMGNITVLEPDAAVIAMTTDGFLAFDTFDEAWVWGHSLPAPQEHNTERPSAHE